VIPFKDVVRFWLAAFALVLFSGPCWFALGCLVVWVAGR